MSPRVPIWVKFLLGVFSTPLHAMQIIDYLDHFTAEHSPISCFPHISKKKKFYSSNCFRGAISHHWRGRVHTISIMAASQTIPRDYSKHFELLESFYRQQGGAEDKYKYSTFLNCCSYRPSENVTSAINLLLISANTSFYIT